MKILIDEAMKLTDPHDHPEPHTMKWTQLEMDYINKRVETAVRQAIEQAQKQDWYPHEEMQEEIARLSKIIGTNAFYQAGHSDALEWAAQMAVLEDPRTSDWVYDDPYELAKALRKGTEMTFVAQKQEPVGEVEQIEIDDDGQASAWFKLHDHVELGDLLYTSPPQRQAIEQAQKQEPVAWATREDFYRELDRSVNSMRQQMEIKGVVMRCADYDVALPIIDIREGHVLVGQVTSPPQRQPLTDERKAFDAYCKTLHPLWNTGISRAEAEGFFHAGYTVARIVPLTDEQRREIAFRWRDGNGTASEIIDMVEAAHGITGEQK